jgi:hypothetical protein
MFPVTVNFKSREDAIAFQKAVERLRELEEQVVFDFAKSLRDHQVHEALRAACYAITPLLCPSTAAAAAAEKARAA